MSVIEVAGQRLIPLHSFQRPVCTCFNKCFFSFPPPSLNAVIRPVSTTHTLQRKKTKGAAAYCLFFLAVLNRQALNQVSHVYVYCAFVLQIEADCGISQGQRTHHRLSRRSSGEHKLNTQRWVDLNIYLFF